MNQLTNKEFRILSLQKDLDYQEIMLKTHYAEWKSCCEQVKRFKKLLKKEGVR